MLSRLCYVFSTPRVVAVLPFDRLPTPEELQKQADLGGDWMCPTLVPPDYNAEAVAAKNAATNMNLHAIVGKAKVKLIFTNFRCWLVATAPDTPSLTLSVSNGRSERYLMVSFLRALFTDAVGPDPHPKRDVLTPYLLSNYGLAFRCQSDLGCISRWVVQPNLPYDWCWRREMQGFLRSPSICFLVTPLLSGLGSCR